MFRASQQPRDPEPVAEPPPDEHSIAVLSRDLSALDRHVNASAGRLPPGAVPQARRITDTLRTALRSGTSDPGGGGQVDLPARLLIGGMAREYLPDSLDRFMRIDPTTATTANRQGHTPVESLLEQLDGLERAAGDMLAAVRSDDVDSLTTQGNFLQTKFSHSDLDL